MSIRVMTRVWEHAPYQEGSLLVLLALADYADDGGICWPKQPDVATKARLTERQLRTIIHKLERDGEILVKAGRGRGNRTIYCVLTGLPDRERDEKRKEFPEIISGINFRFSKPKSGSQKQRKAEVGDTQKRKLGALSDRGLAQQNAADNDPIRHVDPSLDPPTPSATSKNGYQNGAGDGGEIEHLLDEYNIGAAVEIARLYREKFSDVDTATIRQSIENLLADNVPKGTIVNRLRSRPPAPGKPYQRSRASPRTGIPIPTKPINPPDVLAPAQLAEYARAKRNDTS